LQASLSRHVMGWPVAPKPLTFTSNYSRNFHSRNPDEAHLQGRLGFYPIHTSTVTCAFSKLLVLLGTRQTADIRSLYTACVWASRTSLACQSDPLPPMSCHASIRSTTCISQGRSFFCRVRPAAAQLRVRLLLQRPRPCGSCTVYASAQHSERPKVLEIVQRSFSETWMKVFAAFAVAVLLVRSESCSQRNCSIASPTGEHVAQMTFG
jgi:hypothetical protein